MGGLGSRFSSAGYKTPKPLIEVDGLPMFKKAISSLDNIDIPKEYIFVIRKEHVEEFSLDSKIKESLPSSKVVIIPELTRGATETALAAKDELNPESGLIIMDCDLWFSSPSYDNMVSKAIEGVTNIDGGVLTFPADNPRYSYAKINNNDIVTETAEKKVISDNAITGAYFFTKASKFIESAEAMLSNELSDDMKEYYISPLYNIIIKNSGTIKAAYVKDFASFGTPEELNQYILNSQNNI
jgi:NDP-sugar pyrophosphorylase family protein